MSPETEEVTMIFVYFNVNEDGAVYDKHYTVVEALKVLRSHPNDTVVVAMSDSPADKRLTAEMEG